MLRDTTTTLRGRIALQRAKGELLIRRALAVSVVGTSENVELPSVLLFCHRRRYDRWNAAHDYLVPRSDYQIRE